MSITRIIGIDFGTSTSVIRTKRYEDGKPLGDQLYTKEVKFGNSGLVPTLIQHIEGAQPYYGYDAQKKHKNAVTHENFKVGLESPDERIRMQSRKLTEEFFSYMAKKYKEQESMGFFGETDDAVKTLVSYPVKWSEETRAFMMEAARKAGFANVEGMDEAQAAITAVMVQSADHLSKRNYLRDGTPVNILIADMGAGTTDLVLCRYTPGKDPRYEILSAWPKDGNTLFGGREVEALLQEYLRGKIPGEKADAVMRRFSIEKAKSWKEDYVSPALRRCETVTECGELDVIAELLEINVEEFSLERSEMERLAGDYLKGFPMLVNGCLRDAGIPGSNVELVLLTGGHSQWYFVEEQLCGRLNQYGEIDLGKIRSDPGRLISVPCPQETVALGLVYSPLIKEQVTFAPKPVQQAPARPAAQSTAGNPLQLSEPEESKHSFYLVVKDIFYITGRGVVVTGVIQRGSVELNDFVCVKRQNSTVARCRIAGIEMKGKLWDAAYQGDDVALLLKDVRRGKIEEGDVLVEDGHT